MIKFIPAEVWSIDAEWVPDVDTGRRVYGLDRSVSDEDVIARMYQEGGATEEEPRPYLKTILCRLVSVATFVRRRRDDGRVEFDLHSVPELNEGALPEAEVIGQFLGAVGATRPQLVGFNLQGADLPILRQRAMVCGVSAPEFCDRPEKPWQGVDYFARFSDWVVDLMDVYGSRPNPRLHELATAARIPGKLDNTGADVIDMWRAGDIPGIVGYNRCDVLTTYLIWLRSAHVAGLLDRDAFEHEQEQFESFLVSRIGAGEDYLSRFRDEWTRLRKR